MRIWLVWMLVRSARELRRSDDSFIVALSMGVLAAAVCLVFLDASGTRFRNQGVMSYLWILGGGLAREVANSTEPDPPPRSL